MNCQHIFKKNNNKGFTLIEVVIAMGIFAIGILALASLHLSAIRGDDTSREMSEASNVGMALLEDLMVSSYTGANLTPGTHTRVEDKYTITWLVINNSPVTETKTINATIRWNDGGTIRTLRMDHIIAEINK